MFRLSEAIRLGASLHRQAFDTMEVHDAFGGGLVATCALGAARVAAGFDGLKQIFDGTFVGRWEGDCPVCQCWRRQETVQGLIIHLNDTHRWTREAIADWVETVEALEGSRTDAAVQAPEAVLV